MRKHKIVNKTVEDWASKYKGEKFHALLTDAPYHLTTIVKRFGKKNSAPAKFGTDGVYARASRGFMGQEWDGGDVAFRPETWSALGEHLYPGAFGMTFGGARTAHRIAIALEDAGYIIHPMIVWLYGQGFPKATRVKGKKKFEGHRYGMQALKPAAEPIIVFQKPFDGRPLTNILKTGAGTLNIEQSRVPLYDGKDYTINTFDNGARPFGGAKGEKFTSRKVSLNGGAYSKVSNRSTLPGGKTTGVFAANKNTGKEYEEPSGRWPANVILDTVSAQALDKQTGNLGKSPKSNGNAIIGEQSNGVIPFRRGNLIVRNDEGGASRFFFNVQEQIDTMDPFYYCGKVSVKERNAGLEDRPEKEVGHNRFDKCSNCGGYMFQNQTRKSACKCDNPQRQNNFMKNDHPTLKPIKLTQYLASMLLPPDPYSPRRLLVPFSGTGSEMIGGIFAGWEYVEGIEMGEHYCDLAEARIKYWKGKK